MSKVSIFFIMSLGVIFLAGCEMPKISRLTSSPVAEVHEATNSVAITSKAIVPKKITVSLGTEVNFVNEDKSPHTVASDPHPTHDQLQNLYSTPIFKGQTYAYTFTKKGKFGFHLEDNPSISGEIVVE